MANTGTLTGALNLVGELSEKKTLTASLSVPDFMPEIDPVFNASPASEITENDIENWNNKSDFSGSYTDLSNKPYIPSKTSDLVNNSGYIIEESDPTVPSWAKAPTKPSYTVNEIGGKHNVSLGDDINEIYDEIYYVTNSLDSKVDKVAGKGLSTNDYTTAEKNKLNSISAGANETTWTQITNTGTKIATISIDGTSTDVYAPEGGGGTITDVQVNGTSVVSSGVASIDLTGKVDKETGKGLSTNDFTTTLKNKLDGISNGAEANVQSNWNETNTSSDAYIQNKPTNVSAFTNDAGYLTLSTLPIYDGSVT